MPIKHFRALKNVTEKRSRHYRFYATVSNTNLYTDGPNSDEEVPCAEIHVYGAGDLVVTRVDGTNVTMSLAAGAVLPIEARALVASGSTATNVLVLW